MDSFGTVPPFDEDHYHLAIVEKKSRFIVYADLDGLRYLQAELNAELDDAGIDHTMTVSNGDRQFMVGAPKLGGMIIWINPPHVSSRELPRVYRKPGKWLGVELTFDDAERLFNELGRLASQVGKGKEASRVELPYGIAIEYLKDW